jgi:AraC-like DNA-binding protein
LLVARAVRSGDPLALELELYGLVGAVLSSIGGRHRPVRRERVATRRAHAELVDQARMLLARRLGEPLTLDAIAAELATTPFHLARLFREATGVSLHEYRDALRLRASVERLVDGNDSLTRIGLDLGYASSSHYSDRFRRRFAVPPSAVRQLVSQPA